VNPPQTQVLNPGDIAEFTFTSSIVPFNLIPAVYRLECWGAEGGMANAYRGGLGGYSVGNFIVSTASTFFICVGGMGAAGDLGAPDVVGGYNGGGSGGNPANHGRGASGGGASHIARQTGLLSTFNDNRSQIIIVAGGGGGGSGGGSGGQLRHFGGNGGGLTGNAGNFMNSWAILNFGTGQGGTQSAGGAGGVNAAFPSILPGSTGSFGQGATGGASFLAGPGNQNWATWISGGGGGGGWFGGGGGAGGGTTGQSDGTSGGGGSGSIQGVTEGQTSAGGFREGHGLIRITRIAGASNDLILCRVGTSTGWRNEHNTANTLKLRRDGVSIGWRLNNDPGTYLFRSGTQVGWRHTNFQGPTPPIPIINTTLVYQLNGGHISSNPATVSREMPSGQEITLDRIPTPLNTSHTFAGWLSAWDGVIRTRPQLAAINSIPGTMILTALWSIN